MLFMGKKNDAIVPFLKNKEHFSDLLNGSLFNGKQIVVPNELELLDGESGIIFETKNKKKRAINRYRDIVMSWRKQVTFVVLACEVQENVHYAMPVRNMLYDSLSYVDNLINPTKIQDCSVFKSDLQLIFDMLKYKNDKEKLFRFTKDNSSYFKSVNSETAYAIGMLLNADKLLGEILDKDEKEDKNMCKALEDLYNDGVTEGRLEGKEETIKNTIALLKSLNMSDEEIKEKLISYFDYDERQALDCLYV